MTTESSTSPSQTPTQMTAPRSRAPRRIIMILLAVIAIVFALHFAGVLQPRPRLAIVTASQDPYWDLVVKGATDAAQRFDVNLIVIRSPGDEDQQARPG